MKTVVRRQLTRQHDKRTAGGNHHTIDASSQLNDLDLLVPVTWGNVRIFGLEMVIPHRLHFGQVGRC